MANFTNPLRVLCIFSVIVVVLCVIQMIRTRAFIRNLKPSTMVMTRKEVRLFALYEDEDVSGIENPWIESGVSERFRNQGPIQEAPRIESKFVVINEEDVRNLSNRDEVEKIGVKEVEGVIPEKNGNGESTEKGKNEEEDTLEEDALEKEIASRIGGEIEGDEVIVKGEKEEEGKGEGKEKEEEDMREDADDYGKGKGKEKENDKTYYLNVPWNFSLPFFPYHNLNSSDFYIETGKKEDSYKITLQVEHQNELVNCSLDLSSIIPSIMSSHIGVNHDDYPLLSDLQRNERNNRIDEGSIRNEEYAKSSDLYRVMRQAVEKKNDTYAKDHIDAEYSKYIHKQILLYERTVIEGVYNRLTAVPCFNKTRDRFRSKKKEFTIPRKEFYDSMRLLAYKHWNRHTKVTANALKKITDKMVDAFLETWIKDERGKRVSHYNSYKYRPNPFDTCDGCSIPRGLKYIKETRPYREKECIRKFEGNIEIIDYNRNQRYYPKDYDTPSITAITITSHNRLFALTQQLYRWRGNIIIVVQSNELYESRVMKYYISHHFPKRVTFLMYFVQQGHPYGNSFPINILRNLAIANVKTTHFMILDIDLMLTTNVYEECQKLPPWVMQSNQSAIILPVFFFNHTLILKNCISLMDCAALVSMFTPENKMELVSCLYEGLCTSHKRYVRTYMYMMPEWFVAKPSSSLSRVRCFISDFQEPYLLMKNTPDTPLFYTQFLNYGYNKVSYFEQLRHMGYSFYIMNHAFAMDFPHPNSKYRSEYTSNMNNAAYDMKNVYAGFQAMLDEKYGDRNKTRVCFLRQYSYYEEL